MARKTGNGVLKHIVMQANLKYVFNSKLRSTLYDNFGQLPVDADFSVAGAILGANSPQPSRASKRNAPPIGYEGSFCAEANIVALRRQGYRISRGKTRVPTLSALSNSVYVTINGVKYAWQMSLPSAEQGSVGEIVQQLGISVADPDADASDLVWGADFPKPARANIQRVDGNGNITASFSTFCDDAKVGDEALVTAGWSFDSGIYAQAAFSNLLKARGLG